MGMENSEKGLGVRTCALGIMKEFEGVGVSVMGFGGRVVGMGSWSSLCGGRWNVGLGCLGQFPIGVFT